MSNTVEEKFPGFDYPAVKLSKFIAAGNIFTLMLKDGSIIHYTTREVTSFKSWLLKNQIEDIKDK